MMQPVDDMSSETESVDTRNGSPVEKCSSDESIGPDSFTKEDFVGNRNENDRVLAESKTDPKEVVGESSQNQTNRCGKNSGQHDNNPGRWDNNSGRRDNCSVLNWTSAPQQKQTAVECKSHSLSEKLRQIANEEAGTLVNENYAEREDIKGAKTFIRLEYCKQTDAQSASSAINRGEKPQVRMFTLETFFTEAERVAKIKAEGTTEEARQKSLTFKKNNVWLVGPAGSGKTCSSKLFLDHASKHSDFKYIFSFQCGNLKLETPQTLSKFLQVESGIGERFLNELKDLQERDDVLFIFDALDEIDLEHINGTQGRRITDIQSGYTHLGNLLSGKVFPRAKKMWTVNIHALNVVKKKIAIETVFQVLPLSKEIQTRFRLSCAQRSEESVQNILESHPEVRELCTLPFFAVIFHSSVVYKLILRHYSLSNFLYLGLQVNIKKLEDKNLESPLHDQLYKLCEAAWNSFVAEKQVIEDGLEDLSPHIKGRFLVPGGKQGTRGQKYKFQHRFRQYFLASIYAMTTLGVDDFKEKVNFGNMSSDKWKMMAACLFGMCDSSKHDLCDFIPKQDSISKEKRAHLMETAVAMAHEAKFANGYDERIQALFRVGRWMQEANDDDMLAVVAQHLPAKVQLADKIFPADVRALTRLARSRDMTLSLGIMSSPRFQDDAALLLFKTVTEVNDLRMSSVDLRGNTISEEVAAEMAKCIGKFDSLNLASTESDESALCSVVEAIGALPKTDHRLRLVLGHSKMRMSNKLTNGISEAVRNLRELVLVVEHVSDSGLKSIVGTIKEMPAKLDLLDLGIPTLGEEIAEELGKCLTNIRCLHLRGCKVAKNSIGHLGNALLMLPNAFKMRGFFLDHADVTDDDVEVLSRCLPKIHVWLVIMYCGVTKKGYEILQAAHDQLQSNNCLQIFLGDVEGVGESVNIRK